ncbi:MAG: glycosyltransferase family 4 protein [Bacteroidia bacterium]|jgi:glycosyltransferase involved in cell wall biosynthesis|nr:glycosyltransferase family 4 protein [Bacteroidia bacterium]
MRIAVNTRFLLYDKLEGIGRFTHEILQRITRANPQHEFIFLFDRPYHPSFIYSDNVTPVVLYPQARHPFLFYLFFEHAIPYALKKYKADVFLSTDGFLSLSSSVKQYPVIHDLAFLHHPDGISRLQKLYYNYYFPKFANKAERIITVSNYTKTDLIKQYQIPDGKINIVYNAPSLGFKPISFDEKNIIKKGLTNDCPYFLYVGALHPRKNISRLLQAFDTFKKNKPTNFKLVIIGRKAWQTSDVEKVYQSMESKDEVIFTGRLPEAELYQITAAAFCLVYVPLFEGFGLPIVEAMSCGVPVITSTTSSMPEVAGNAGIIVNPYIVDEISNAMLSMINQPELVNHLQSNAIAQSAKFNWDHSAQQLSSLILNS